MDINLSKTSLCRFFENNGSCPNGRDCKNAHGERELRRVNNNTSKKEPTTEKNPL
jgi:hypothetical protein